MSAEQIPLQWRRIYVDIPVDTATAMDVEAAKLRISKKQFVADAIGEKITKHAQAEAVKTAPLKRKGSK